MMGELLTGFAVSIVNISIHALVMSLIVRVARIADEKRAARSSASLIGVMIVTVTILMAVHTCEVIVWSQAYAIVHAAPDGTDLVYFAFVNYTTLGYGDVTHVKQWQLLGPITAMNGMLLFGWSTAVIFEVLRRTMLRINMVRDV
jgi:hypothetical protein